MESRVRLDGLMTDLSEGGCCVLTREPFSRGTRILLEITKNGVSLLTRATVAYALEGKAMGLCFLELPPDQAPILEGWLRAAILSIRRDPQAEKN